MLGNEDNPLLHKVPTLYPRTDNGISNHDFNPYTQKNKNEKKQGMKVKFYSVTDPLYIH